MAELSGLKALMAARKGISDVPAIAPQVDSTPTPPVVQVEPARVNVFARRFGAAKPVDQPAVSPAISGLDDEIEFNLDSLADIEDEGISPSQIQKLTKHQFDDETPATKPTRELPPDIEKGMKQFVDLIDGVYDILGDSELLGNVIRSIMIELKSNPQYMKMVGKEDIHQWVKAMRDSMGMARIKKQEKKRAPASKGKGVKLDADMEQAFADMGLDLGDL